MGGWNFQIFLQIIEEVNWGLIWFSEELNFKLEMESHDKTFKKSGWICWISLFSRTGRSFWVIDRNLSKSLCSAHRNDPEPLNTKVRPTRKPTWYWKRLKLIPVIRRPWRHRSWSHDFPMKTSWQRKIETRHRFQSSYPPTCVTREIEGDIEDLLRVAQILKSNRPPKPKPIINKSRSEERIPDHLEWYWRDPLNGFVSHRGPACHQMYS